MFNRIKRFIIGAPHDAMDKRTSHRIALTALLAWVGLGADGLSSSCYGPQEAFLALGQNTSLAIYLALATALTVFIIAFAYNQIIELFPNGGGGYKVTTQLMSKHVGVIAGAALIIDYVLTIVISIASGTDAIFSLLPPIPPFVKVRVESLLVIALVLLNLRGMQESIKVLMPIFIGFIVTHLLIIFFGIFYHSAHFPAVAHHAIQESHQLVLTSGVLFTAGLFLHAYSVGGGTYTGLEAVSNNVNRLAEPRVRTGKWAMAYMAISLSITAGGIVLLYLLENVHPQSGQTLNAIAFRSLLRHVPFAQPFLVLTLLFEFGLLIVAANTGFLGGPAVLANMAMDQWMPNRFMILSSRLVTQNGILIFGLAALLLLNITQGHVSLLVILYSVNVFLAFMLSMLSLCKFWLQQRGQGRHWIVWLILSFVGFILCASIFFVAVTSRFFSGGSQALLFTAVLILFCYWVRHHYLKVRQRLAHADKLFQKSVITPKVEKKPLYFDVNKPTAVFFIGKSIGAGVHTVLWVKRLFPEYFANYIFVSTGIVDVKSYGAEKALETMKEKVERDLQFFVDFSQQHQIPVRAYSAYGTDPVVECIAMAEKIRHEIPNCMFFASQWILERDNWLTRFLHNQTAFSIQRRLYLEGMQMMVLPMKL